MQYAGFFFCFFQFGHFWSYRQCYIQTLGDDYWHYMVSNFKCKVGLLEGLRKLVFHEYVISNALQYNYVFTSWFVSVRYRHWKLKFEGWQYSQPGVKFNASSETSNVKAYIYLLYIVLLIKVLWERYQTRKYFVLFNSGYDWSSYGEQEDGVQNWRISDGDADYKFFTLY